MTEGQKYDSEHCAIIAAFDHVTRLKLSVEPIQPIPAPCPSIDASENETKYS